MPENKKNDSQIEIEFIERVCDQFEDGLRLGKQPSVGDFLQLHNDQPANTISKLGECLLATVWDYQCENSEVPRLDDDSLAPFLSRERINEIFESWKMTRATEREFGEFQLVELLGEGQFGAVWKALDPNGKLVALKIAHPGLKSGESGFFREAKVATGLTHPGLANYHSFGVESGRAYLVREYIEGTTLADEMSARNFSFQESVAVILEIAQPITFLHRQGYIHRDIKPRNILVSSIDGTLRVIDFGLAKALVSESNNTQLGAIIGTAAYMSPEQAQGNGKNSDARSDVYSLGVVLFELLTGERPFNGDFASTINHVVNTRPPNPRQLNPNVPKSLDRICRKCLQKLPAERYQSVNDFVKDLERFQRGESIVAKNESEFTRAARFAKANPIIGLLSLALLTLLTAFAVNSHLAERRTRQMLQRESKLLKEAEAAKNNAIQIADQLRVETRVAKQTAQLLESVFAQSDPIEKYLFTAGNSQTPAKSAQEMLDGAVERLSFELVGQPRLHAHVLDVIAGINCNLGRTDVANLQLETSEKIRSSMKGDHGTLSEDTALHQLVKGKVFQFEGRYHDSEVSLVTSIQLFRTSSDSHPCKLEGDALFQLGWLYHEWQKPWQAKEVFTEALEIYRDELGMDHRLYKATELGIKVCDELEVEDIAVLLQSTSNASENLDVLEVAYNLLMAESLKAAKQFDLATEAHQRALDGIESAGLGNSRWHLLASGVFARTLFELGDYKQAIEIIQPALNTGYEISPCHPKVIEAARKFAYELMLAKQYEKSERWYRLALTDINCNAWVANETALRFTEVLLATDRTSEAATLMDRLDQTSTDSTHNIWIQYNRYRIHKSRGEEEQAKQCLDAAFTGISRLDSGQRSPSNHYLFSKIALASGATDQAEQFLKVALQQAKAAYPRQHPRISEQLFYLGEFYFNQQRLMEAKPLLTECRNDWRFRLPPDDVRIKDAEKLVAACDKTRP